MTKTISVIVGILIGVATLVSLGIKYDSTVAKAEDVDCSIQKLDCRLEQKILEDRINNLQERIWRIEDRYGEDCDDMPEEIREVYRKFLLDRDDVARRLDSIVKKQP